jgi:hypothetical protein
MDLMKIIRLSALVVMLSSAAMAGTSFCAGLLGDSLETINGSPGSCEAADMIFSMFQASGGSGVGSSFDPGLSALIMYETDTSVPVQTPAPPVLDNTAFGITPTASTAWGSAGTPTSSSYGYLAALDPTYAPQPNAPYTNWALDEIALSLNQNITGILNIGDTVTVTENFCLGGGAGSLPPTPLTCSGAGQVLGSVSVTATQTSSNTLTYSDTCSFAGGTCSGGNINTVVLTLPLSVQIYQALTVEDVITSSSTGSIMVPEILNEFNQVGVGAIPESSTFVLIGSALLAIGCLRHRRVRQRLLNQSIDS